MYVFSNYPKIQRTPPIIQAVGEGSDSTRVWMELWHRGQVTLAGWGPNWEDAPTWIWIMGSPLWLGWYWGEGCWGYGFGWVGCWGYGFGCVGCWRYGFGWVGCWNPPVNYIMISKSKMRSICAPAETIDCAQNSSSQSLMQKVNWY